MPNDSVRAVAGPKGSARSGEAETVTLRFRDVAQLLVRGAPFALIVTLLSVTAAVLVTRTQDPIYRAGVALVASQGEPRYSDIEVIVPPVVDPGVYRTAIYEGDVLRSALEEVEGRELGDTEYLRLSEAVRVRLESQPFSSLVRIDVTDTSPERAARLANTIAAGIVAWDQDRARQGLEQGVSALERSIAAIEAELAANGTISEARDATLRALRAQRAEELEQARDASAAAVAVGRLELLAPASPPEEAVGPRLVLNSAIALLLGLVLGYGLIVFSWTSNPRVADGDDLARFSGLPVLARFPRARRGSRRLSYDASSWLRTRLNSSATTSSGLVVVVAGLRVPGDKDGVAVGLAESFARTGAETLLVDADLIAARATAWLGIDAPTGTPYEDAALEDPRSAEAPMSVVVGRNRAFDVVPAPTGLKDSGDRLAQALDSHAETWRDRYDVVVIDAVPILASPDALAATRFADGVVLCARSGRASKRELENALALLEEQHVPVLGTVLTGGRRVGRDT